MNPEDVPQALIDKVRAAATGKPGLPDEMSDGVIVTVLVAAWDYLRDEVEPHCCGM